MGKRKRSSKRLFPRRMASDFINVTQKPDVGKMLAYSFLNNRSRVKTHTGDRGSMEPTLNRDNEERKITNMEDWFSNRFMDPIPDTRTRRLPVFDGVTGKRVLVNTAKEETKKRAGEVASGTVYGAWRGDRHQGTAEFVCRVLKEFEGFSMRLYLNGSELFFVQETDTDRWVSKEYNSLDMAMHHYREKSIEWYEHETIEPKT